MEQIWGFLLAFSNLKVIESQLVMMNDQEFYQHV